MGILKFELHGNPKPKQSARHSVGPDGHIRSWQSSEVVNEMNNIRYSITQQLPEGFIPINTGIRINLWFKFEVPKTYERKFAKLEQESLFLAPFFKTTKPDIDNLQKMVLDAMQGVVFTNDALIYSLSATKVLDRKPGITIEVITDERIVCQ